MMPESLRSSKASVGGDENACDQSHVGAERMDSAKCIPPPVGPPSEPPHYPSSNNSNHNNKPGLFPLWTRLTNAIHRMVTNFIVTLSLYSAHHPYRVIGVSVFISLALVTTGLLTNFHINVKETEIFAPFNSIPGQHMQWRNDEAGFLQATRVTTLVIHANGANVLGKEPMERVFYALDTVRNMSGYHDICEDGDYYDERADEFTCRILSTTRFWYHDTKLFYEQAQTDEDVIATLSQPQYPVNIPADHDFVLGKYQRDDNGTITSVPAYFVYILLSIKDDTEAFESKIIERLSALQTAWIQEEGNMLRLEYFAERSFSDEFSRAIEADMFLVPIGFIMMAGFTCVVFYQSDRIQSRSGLGVGSVFTIGMSLMT
jgi:hypothetical protein